MKDYIYQKIVSHSGKSHECLSGPIIFLAPKCFQDSNLRIFHGYCSRDVCGKHSRRCTQNIKWNSKRRIFGKYCHFDFWAAYTSSFEASQTVCTVEMRHIKLKHWDDTGLLPFSSLQILSNTVTFTMLRFATSIDLHLTASLFFKITN